MLQQSPSLDVESAGSGVVPADGAPAASPYARSGAPRARGRAGDARTVDLRCLDRPRRRGRDRRRRRLRQVDPGPGRLRRRTAGVRSSAGAATRLAHRGPSARSGTSPARPAITSLVRGDEVSLAQLCEEVYEALHAEPTVLVVEDIHWIDAASVDVLRFLARRVDDNAFGAPGDLPRPRDRPLPPGPPVARGPRRARRAPTCWSCNRCQRGRAHRCWTAPASSPARVHELTGGNPFFVTEVLKDPLPPAAGDGPRRGAREDRRRRCGGLRGPSAGRDGDRTGSTTGCFPCWASTLRRCAGSRSPACSRASAAGWSSVTRSHGRRSRARSRPVGRHGSTRLLDALEQVDGHEPAVLTHHAVAAYDAPRAVRLCAGGRGGGRSRAGRPCDAAAFLEIALHHLSTRHRRKGPSCCNELALRAVLDQPPHLSARHAQSVHPAVEGGRRASRAGDRPRDLRAIFEYYNARRRQAEAHAERATAIARDAGAPRSRAPRSRPAASSPICATTSTWPAGLLRRGAREHALAAA